MTPHEEALLQRALNSIGDIRIRQIIRQEIHRAFWWFFSAYCAARLVYALIFGDHL